MCSEEQVAIVIPVYKKKLSLYEAISLQQALKIFSNYEVIAVAPSGLPLEQYGFTQIERFESKFFCSVDTYNLLMLSPFFYERFQKYEYILIYQLDAFIFSDKLSYFCSFNYDYIGAPWLYGVFHYYNASHCIWHVGNGGLSLRKIESFINILKKRKPLQSEQIKNEDLFYSSVFDEDFKVAPMEIALQFAFERQVEECYVLNHCELPFGCHAWNRYNLRFWKPYIEQSGYMLEENAEKIGGEDETRRLEYDCYTHFSAFFEHNYDSERTKQELQKILDNNHKAFIILGAGYYGMQIVKWFEDLQMPIRGFCDNDRSLWGGTLQGYPIFSVGELSNYKKDIFILIASREHEVPMLKQLSEMNFVYREDFLSFTDFVKFLCNEKRERVIC